MRNWVFFIFLCLTPFFVSLSANGEVVRWRESRSGRIDFWLKRSEDGRIYLERLTAQPGKLQVLQKQMAYDNPELAEKMFRSVTRGFSSKKPYRLQGPAGMVSETQGEVIWPTTEAWNLEWERKFADWVRDNVDATFFSRHKIATDCADVAVAIRWIFSRINGLPVANHLMGTGQIFGNESMRESWLPLPAGGDWSADPRFRAALEYAMVHTYTHSIMRDLYPISISPTTVTAGTVLLHLYNEETGHTEVVRWAGSGQANAIQMIASNVPREVRDLMDYGIQDWGEPPVSGRDGLLHFLWPVKMAAGFVFIEPEQMPFYSSEQYSPAFLQGYENFTEAVIAKVVPGFTFDPKLALRARTAELLDRLKNRVKVVETGYAYCSQNACPEGSAAWDTWSTPSRDAAIGRLVRAAMEIHDHENCSYFCRRELDSHRRDELTQIGQGMPYSLGEALSAWEENRFSSNPNDEIKTRWGW